MKSPNSKTKKAETTDQKKPKGAEPENDTSAKDAKKVNVNVDHKDSLDKWNDRLDQNLESEKESDPRADEKAKAYSEKHGSGDQSDDNQNSQAL